MHMITYHWWTMTHLRSKHHQPLSTLYASTPSLASPAEFILCNFSFPKDVMLVPGNPLYVIAVVEPTTDPPLAFLAVICPQLNQTPFCCSVACAAGFTILLLCDSYVAMTMFGALSDSTV
jgi:hypothetical protein